MQITIQIKDNPNELRRGGAPSGAPVSVFLPLDDLKYWDPGDELTDIMVPDEVIVTEGEHKGYISANILKKVVVAVPGVGNYKDVLPLLIKWRVKKVIAAFDADAFVGENGEKKNEEVFKNLISFSKEILEKEGINLVFYIWNIKDGKGLDDLLHKNKLPIEVNPRTNERIPVTL